MYDPHPPDQQLQMRESAAIVERFIASLPDKLRDVFVLAEIEGMSAPEIERALGVKLNTVYSRLRLARGRFGRLVQTLNDDETGAAHG